MQTQVAGNFPNGVPVSSDASMRDWMGYVFQQQPEPTNFTGVPVQLAVLDSNGNHYAIGSATTDASGSYSLTWAPTIPGSYTIYATFAGTNGYYPSYSETHLTATTTATAEPTATPISLASTQSYVLSLGIATIIVIIIIGAVLAMLLLRKRQ